MKIQWEVKSRSKSV